MALSRPIGPSLIVPNLEKVRKMDSAEAERKNGSDGHSIEKLGFLGVTSGSDRDVSNVDLS